MPKELSGYLDDGRGEPLADIPAVATILGTTTVVDSTLTDDEGRWTFSDLPTADEYLVTLTDTAGNAVSRAPWSGEMRELWVRDRLDVTGLPVLLDPAAGNALLWTATGLYAPTAPVTDLTNYWTKTEADARYATSAHNHDTTYVQLTGGSVMTGLLGPSTHNTRDLGTTGTRWRKLWSVDAEFTNAPTVGGVALLTSTTADALFLTPAEGNAAYATAAHNHDTTYVQLTGGSVMTGLLGPTSTNTRDLGTTALRWRKLWAVDGEFTNVPTVGGVALLTPTAADTAYVNVGGDTMTGALTVQGVFSNGAAAPYTILTDLTNKRVWINQLNAGLTPTLAAGAGLVIQRNDTTHAELINTQAYTSAGIPMWSAYSAAGTAGTPTQLTNGRVVQGTYAYAYNAGWKEVGHAQFTVDGTPGASWTPGAFAIATTNTTGASADRLRVGNAGLVGIGGKADGTAGATLDVQATANTTGSFVARSRSDYSATAIWAGFFTYIDSWAFGVSHSGWHTDYASATALGTFANKRIPVYNGAGVLQGHIPLYT